MRSSINTINGRKPIGDYNPITATYSKYVKDSHRLWKAGGAYTVDKAYLDDIWPECQSVEVYNQTKNITYFASVDKIREHTWRDSNGNLHQDRWGEQYALPFMYWVEKH